jgi:hypothetical protein
VTVAQARSTERACVEELSFIPTKKALDFWPQADLNRGLLFRGENRPTVADSNWVLL